MDFVIEFDFEVKYYNDLKNALTIIYQIAIKKMQKKKICKKKIQAQNLNLNTGEHKLQQN